MTCWSTPSLRRRSLRLSEPGMPFSQWVAHLIDQCSELGISLGSLPSVSQLGIDPASWSDVSEFGTVPTDELVDYLLSSEIQSANLRRLSDRRGELISELHDESHRQRALPPDVAFQSDNGLWMPRFEEALLRMLR
jgi:hypothetical protein